MLHTAILSLLEFETWWLWPLSHHSQLTCILYLFIYLFIGRESKRTYMTDGVKKKWEINAMLREYTFYFKIFKKFFISSEFSSERKRKGKNGSVNKNSWPRAGLPEESDMHTYTNTKSYLLKRFVNIRIHVLP